MDWTIEDDEGGNGNRHWKRMHNGCAIRACEPTAGAGDLPATGHRQVYLHGTVTLSAVTPHDTRDPDRVADALAQLLLETAIHAEAIAAPVAEAAELAPWLDAETARRQVV